MLFFPVDTQIFRPGYAKITKSLAMISVVAYVVLNILLEGSEYQDIRKYLYLTDKTGISYRFITYQFLHGDFWHILGNMIFFLPFGAVLEDKVGPVKTVMLYLLGGIFSAVVWQLLFDNPTDIPVPLVGASGSISAITAAAFVFRPKLPLTGLFWIFIFINFFRLPVWIWAIFFFVNDFIRFLFTGNESNIAYTAHLGGFAANFVICVLMLIVGWIPTASSDLLSTIGIKLKRKEESVENKLKTSRGYHDINAVDHVIEELNKGEDEKHEIDDLLVLSKKAVNHGKPVEGYQILQAWIDKNDRHPQAHEVAYEIGLICVRHLHKKDLAKSWFQDALGRNPTEKVKSDIQHMLSLIQE